MAEMKSLKRKTLYKEVADELKEYIINNGLQSGDRLPTEHELAKILGVSRNSVREGIRYLETLGLIETRIKTGITVKKDNLEPISEYLLFSLKNSKVSWKEIVDARRALESIAIELVVENIDEEQISQMEQSISEMETKIKNNENSEHEDYMFHYILFKATKNKIIEQFNAILKEFFHNEELNNQIKSCANIDNISDQSTLSSHKIILEAIKNKDIEGAKRELSNHFKEYETVDMTGKL